MSVSEPLLRGVVARSLEEVAFMFAIPTDDAPAELDQRVHLGFQGGAVCVSSTIGFGRALAATLLAIEPDDPLAEESAAGALKELTNILAGLLVEAAWGSGRTVTLGIPELDAPDSVVAGELAATADFLVDDEHPLRVSVLLDPGSPA